MPTFALDAIDFDYGPKAILSNVALTFERGFFYGIIGPNGSGKTTLLDLLAGHLRPRHGTLLLEERALVRYSRKALARRIALVAQDFRIDFPFTSAEVVMMGRYPYIPRFGRPGVKDRQVVARVLQEAGLTDLAGRHVHRLSGGERQRVVFARALAQESAILLLDEATAHLDMHHTIGLLNLAARRVAQGALVIAVMQDLNLAALYCDRLVCLRAGRVVASGAMTEVLTAAMLHTVFRIKARVAHSAAPPTRQVVLTKEAV